MTRVQRTVVLLSILSLALSAAEIDVTDFSRLDFRNATVEQVTYRGQAALKMTEKDAAPGSAYAIVKGLAFHDGTIELEVSGAPSKTAFADARGFIGILFRVDSGGSQFESFYLRPSNGRADNQLQRNHSVQYVSIPGWDWKRLRDETRRASTSHTPICSLVNGRACASWSAANGPSFMWVARSSPA